MTNTTRHALSRRVDGQQLVWGNARYGQWKVGRAVLLLTRPRFAVWLTLGKSVCARDTVDHFSGPLHATLKAQHPCSSIEAGSASRAIGFEQCARRRHWVQLWRRCHLRIRAMHWPCLQPPVQGVETVSGLNACSQRPAATDKRKGWVCKSKRPYCRRRRHDVLDPQQKQLTL